VTRIILYLYNVIIVRIQELNSFPLSPTSRRHSVCTHPPWLIIKERERLRRHATPLFTGQNSYLLGPSEVSPTLDQGGYVLIQVYKWCETGLITTQNTNHLHRVLYIEEPRFVVNPHRRGEWSLRSPSRTGIDSPTPFFVSDPLHGTPRRVCAAGDGLGQKWHETSPKGTQVSWDTCGEGRLRHFSRQTKRMCAVEFLESD
jgi:hypothetical protein